MDVRLNKPRVFLSHSKKDVGFIRPVYESLRECQIDPWLDEIDIRHGQPWLEAIFEDGIPTCDAVIVYLTEASISSDMVKREMDAALLQRLSERRVTLLPYVADPAIRSQLRSDIQTFQIPEWNEANFAQMLPRVVAEVWRSYTERITALATQEERVKRLEAELELSRRSATDSVFSPSEEAEFNYLWSVLDRWTPVALTEDPQEPSAPTFEYDVHTGSLTAQVMGAKYNFDIWQLIGIIKPVLVSDLRSRGITVEEDELHLNELPDWSDELVMFGLLERVPYEPNETSSWMSRTALFGPSYMLVWTPKSNRFRYWLAYSNRLPSELGVRQKD